jgi:catecholate siderophore receptor
MKQTSKTSIREIASTREAIALATLFTVTHSAAAEPAKKEDSSSQKNQSQDGDVLDEVTVNAARLNPYNPQRVQSQKFTAPLVNTPQTISVIPKEVFNQQGAQGLADVLKNTPGITFLAGENGHVGGANSMNIRGFEGSNNIFIDGVRDNGNYGRDIFNVESVEVVKGPAGDNGRGGTGGYINLATKTPQADTFYSGTAAYKFDETDANDHQRLTLDMNQAIANGPVPGMAFRLNALLQGGGVQGRDYAENNSWGLAPSIAFGLGTDTRLTLAYQYWEQNNRPDIGFPGAAVPDTTAPVRPDGSVDRGNFYGLTSDFDDVTSHTIYARFEHDFNDRLRFSNLTRYSLTDREAIYTALGAFTAPATVARSRQAFYRETETFTNQSTITAEFETGFVGHTFAGGLEVAREKAHNPRDFVGLGAPGGTNIYDPDPGAIPVGYNPSYNWVDDITVDTVAIYANDTLKFNEQWQASIGTRLEYFDAEARYKQRATGAVTRYNSDDLIFSGKAGIVYKPKENGSIYAAYGVSALPPGANSLSNDNGSRNNGGPTVPGGPVSGNNNANSDVQRSYNYEVGTKWEFFDKNLTTSLAVFRSERENVSVGTPDPVTGEPTAYGDQSVTGVELGVSGNINENWMVFGGLSYLHSENQDGNDLTFNPDWTANLWTTYRFPIGVTIGAGARYAAATAARIDAATGTETATLPESLIFDAMVSYELTKNVTLRLNVNNLTDEFYARTVNTAADSRRAYLGESRTYTLSADWKF